MPSAHELSAADVAVACPSSPSRQSFPRPPGWRPTAKLLLRAEHRPADGGPRYRLQHRHRDEDAATAEIRLADLTPEGNGTALAIVLKLQRVEAAQNARGEAIEDRFNREQRALQQLTATLAEDRRPDLPRTLQPDGSPREASEALRLSLPLIFCMAGRHAIALDSHPGDRQDLRRDAVSRALGHDPSACDGCEHFRCPPSEDENNPVPKPCRPWVVTFREADHWQALIMPSVRLLILTDMGMSLQNHLEARLADRPGSNASDSEKHYDVLRRKISALYELSQTLAAVHRSGWLHLDLNLDNLCIANDSPDRIRLIDFGHAERHDATRESFRERVPLRRVDFAAAEMQLRTYPLRVRHLGDGTWEAWGLVGWSREWWPARGDLLEVIGRENYPLLRLERTKPDGQKLRMRVRPLNDGNDTVLPATGDFDAVVHRSPSRSADLCSFGLIALCWLTDLQRPMLYRNELAVFDCIISRQHSLSQRARTADEITDENWIEVYRGIFSRYSILIDKTIERQRERVRQSGLTSEDIDRWHYAFVECVRIAVKCIVRHPHWSYGAVHAKGFDGAAEDLKLLIETVDREKPPVVARTAISFEGFFKWMIDALPTSLSKDACEGIQKLCQQLSQSLKTAEDAQGKLSGVLSATRRVQDLLAQINKQMRKVHLYREDYRRNGWLRKAVWERIRGSFTIAYRGDGADESLITLGQEVKELAECVEPTDHRQVVAASVRITAAAAQVSELFYHLRRCRYSPYERGRVEAIVRDWQLIDEDTSRHVKQMTAGRTVAHERYRSQLGEFRKPFAAIDASFSEYSRELTTQREAAEQDAAKTLPIVLKEYLMPAEVILGFARNEVEKLLSEVDSCKRLSKDIADRIDELISDKLLCVDLAKLREDVAELKSQMRALSNRKSWIEG